jgi:hypothetical protein
LTGVAWRAKEKCRVSVPVPGGGFACNGRDLSTRWRRRSVAAGVLMISGTPVAVGLGGPGESALFVAEPVVRFEWKFLSRRWNAPGIVNRSERVRPPRPERSEGRAHRDIAPQGGNGETFRAIDSEIASHEAVIFYGGRCVHPEGAIGQGSPQGDACGCLLEYHRAHALPPGDLPAVEFSGNGHGRREKERISGADGVGQRGAAEGVRAAPDPDIHRLSGGCAL